MIILLGFQLVNSAFDYQVAGRVTDMIENYLNTVGKASNVPAFILNSRAINITDPFSAAPAAFYPSQKIYRNLVGDGNIYVGFETGLFYCYSVDYNLLQTTKSINNTRWIIDYAIDPINGVVTNKNFALNAPYNVTGRPWYQDGKSSNVSQLWSKPFLGIGTDGVTISTSMNFLQPLRKAKLNNKHYDFAGVIATQVDLQYIQSYIVKNFQKTDIKVIVIDKVTLNLIANSVGSTISKQTADGVDFINALDSGSPLISRATKKLVSLNWPRNLILLDGLYLQSTLYIDALPGIAWYIVVLLPATIEVDHLGPKSNAYYAVIAMAVFAILACVAGLCTTAYFWKMKLMKLTKPSLTCVVLLGGILLSADCILLLGENTNTSCTIRIWLFNLAFTLAFSPLLVKSYLVHWIFNIRILQKKTVNMSVVLMSTLGFVLLDSIILATMIYTDKNQSNAITTTQLISNGAYGDITTCNSNTLFLYVEIIFKGSLIVSGCLLSFLIRDIVDGISGSKALLVIIYNVGFISGVVVLITQSLTDVTANIITMAAGICYCVIITAALMVIPTVYTLITKGDDEATDSTMSRLRNHQASSFSGSGGSKKAKSFQNSSSVRSAANFSPATLVGQAVGGGSLSFRRSARLQPFFENEKGDTREDSSAKRDSLKISCPPKQGSQSISRRELPAFKELEDKGSKDSEGGVRLDLRHSEVHFRESMNNESIHGIENATHTANLHKENPSLLADLSAQDKNKEEEGSVKGLLLSILDAAEEKDR